MKFWPAASLIVLNCGALNAVVYSDLFALHLTFVALICLFSFVGGLIASIFALLLSFLVDSDLRLVAQYRTLEMFDEIDTITKRHDRVIYWRNAFLLASASLFIAGIISGLLAVYWKVAAPSS